MAGGGGGIWRGEDSGGWRRRRWWRLVDGGKKTRAADEAKWKCGIMEWPVPVTGGGGASMAVRDWVKWAGDWSGPTTVVTGGPRD
uniref:Uncharacterized protein n=1 Tax=Leersia perrieri TaxID=77586 RepID=A0A0D9XTE8_9ORYZ